MRLAVSVLGVVASLVAGLGVGMVARATGSELDEIAVVGVVLALVAAYARHEKETLARRTGGWGGPSDTAREEVVWRLRMAAGGRTWSLCAAAALSVGVACGLCGEKIALCVTDRSFGSRPGVEVHGVRVSSASGAAVVPPPAMFHPFGQPRDEQGRPATYVKNYAYDCSHDPTLKVSRWCGYCYEQAERSLPRRENFRPDYRIPPKERAELADYGGSGYSRGHQAPDAALKVYGEQAQDESYLLSNMTPQRQTLNGGLWAKLEKQIREWARDFDGRVCVTTGPVFYNGQLVQTIGGNEVAVPHAYYAIVMRGSMVEPDVLAFLVPHQDRYTREERDLERYLVAVDEVEEATGFDFLTGLPDPMEAAVEEVAAGSYPTMTRSPPTTVTGTPSTASLARGWSSGGQGSGCRPGPGGSRKSAKSSVGSAAASVPTTVAPSRNRTRSRRPSMTPSKQCWAETTVRPSPTRAPALSRPSCSMITVACSTRSADLQPGDQRLNERRKTIHLTGELCSRHPWAKNPKTRRKTARKCANPLTA